MNFEKELNALLEYCSKPRSSEEIMEKFNLGRQAVYFRLRKLRAEGCLERLTVEGRPLGHGARYEATGKVFDIKKPPQYVRGVTIMGVRL